MGAAVGPFGVVRQRATTYATTLAMERQVLRNALACGTGATTEYDVDHILGLFRGGIDSCHIYDAVREGAQVGARCARVPAVSDREVQFVYELLLIHAVAAPHASDAVAPTSEEVHHVSAGDRGLEGTLSGLTHVVAHTGR